VKGNRHKRTTRGRTPPPDPVTALRDFAIKLHDKGDGRGIDWARAAETVFRVAFSCLDEAKGDERARSVARRVHDGAYSRMAGSPDSETPYAAQSPEAPQFTADPELNPDFGLDR
jgi:hypothetical protein